MMFKDLKPGDIITRDGWGPNAQYEVIEITGSRTGTLKGVIESQFEKGRVFSELWLPDGWILVARKKAEPPKESQPWRRIVL